MSSMERLEPQQWEVDGLGDPEHGGLTRSVAGYWLKPISLELDGEDLVWSITPSVQIEDVPIDCGATQVLQVATGGDQPALEPNRIRPHGTLLEDFLQLASADPKTVLSYAQKWGVLQLCGKHGLPTTHSCAPVPYMGMDAWCTPTSDRRPGYFREPVKRWQWFAVYFRTMMCVAADLHRDSTGTDMDWEMICGGLHDARLKQGPPLQMCQARHGILSDVLNQWLRVSAVQPSYEWDASGASLQFVAPGLFGHLVLQLVLAISGSSGFAFCCNCSRPYMPSRRPPYGQRNYCAVCRNAGAPQRDSAREWYRKKKGIGMR